MSRNPHQYSLLYMTYATFIPVLHNLCSISILDFIYLSSSAPQRKTLVKGINFFHLSHSLYMVSSVSFIYPLQSILHKIFLHNPPQPSEPLKIRSHNSFAESHPLAQIKILYPLWLPTRHWPWCIFLFSFLSTFDLTTLFPAT